MMNAQDLADWVAYTLVTHATMAKKPSKAIRKWDGATPYGVHPAWCAMTILQEPSLPEEVRVRGAATLLYHDITEDTLGSLPSETPKDVVQGVHDMSFAGGSAEEMELVWGKPPEIRLFKLYDKVSNLLDSAWMSGEKLSRYQRYTQWLAEDVALNYGELNIVRMARALARAA